MKRLDAFARLPRTYIRTAWWGLISPYFVETGPLVVVQAVVIEAGGGQGRVLLSVRSDVRGWELPGGAIEADESHEQALVREVEEETGLRVEVDRHVGDYTRTGFRPHTARVFLCRARGGELRPSRETPLVDWWPLDDLPETLLPWYQQPLDDAQQDREEPFSRTDHQGLPSILRAVAIDFRMRWGRGRAR